MPEDYFNVESTNEGLHLHEQVKPQDGRTWLEMVAVSELRGGYPNVVLPDDIDVQSIQARGYKFITLPIGQVDAKSRNGRNYKRTAVEQLVEQINAKRPEGGWGHIKDEDMGTSYGPPAIRWLAAMIDKKGTVWGKGLPLTDETQHYFALSKETTSRVGTSLHAWVTMEGDDVTELDLIKLDLADPARVGIPMTAAMPALSTEMQPDPAAAQQPESDEAGAPAAASSEAAVAAVPIVHTEQESEPVTDTNTTRVTELELERKDLKAEIAKFETENNRLKRIAEDTAEVREKWHIAADADLVKAAREFKNQYDEMAKEASELLMDAATAKITEKVKVESARDVVMELVRAEKPLTRKELNRVIDAVLERDSIKKLLEIKVVEEMGGNQPPPTNLPATNQTAAEKWLEPVEAVT